MQNYAQQLAAQGRYGDSMLVHMNPQEVSGLQALARSQGKTMTVNPNTGLPEAFNLSNFLPMIIGAGLAATGIGAPAAAMLTGAGYTAATGSLKKGLMAGLGAYGGAGVGESLVSAGNALPEATAAKTVSSVPATGSPFAAPAPTAGMTGAPNQLLGAGDLMNYPTVGAPQMAQFGQAGSTGMGNVLPTTGGSITGAPGSSLATAGRGAQAIMGGNEAAQSAFMEKIGGPSGLATKGTAMLAAGYEPPKPPKIGSDPMIRPYTFSWNEQTGSYDPVPSPGDSSERYYVRPTFTPGTPYKAAQGGLMSYAAGGPTAVDLSDSYDDERGQDGYTRSMAVGGLTAFKQGGRPDSRRLMGQDPYSFQTSRETMLDAVERNFAGGGTPRFLSGGGDGMSDSIPAMIGDKQPARLADGEFVIPADVVSHIGNGSSKAGAEKLYGMMDKIREKRTGKTKQAPAIKAEKYMPA